MYKNESGKMKSILILASLLVSLAAGAQGTVNFANIVLSGGARIVDSPVFDGATGTRVAGDGFQAQL